METGSLKIHGVTKIKEEITYANARKTQVRSYDFTNDLGTINVTLFMADEPTVVEAYNSVTELSSTPLRDALGELASRDAYS
tara:strand:+ start:4941 stop:5186 length:246 start_codon:yes stop_codon:yes gene_type:complete